MATTPDLEGDVEEPAVERVLDYLHATRPDGRLVYPLVELSRETALDPGTVEAAMGFLERAGPYTVSRQGGQTGELRWLVRGSVYDLDGPDRLDGADDQDGLDGVDDRDGLDGADDQERRDG